MIEFDEAVFRQKTDSELERLLGQFDDLVDDAQRCLISELKARGRSEQSLSQVVESARKRRIQLSAIEGVDLPLTAEIGSIRRTRGMLHGTRFLGTGRAFYGSSNGGYNKEYGYREFDSTLWWVLLGIPLVPRGSFRIRSRVPASYILGANFVVLRGLPFLWLQNAGWLALDALVLLFLALWGFIAAIQKA